MLVRRLLVAAPLASRPRLFPPRRLCSQVSDSAREYLSELSTRCQYLDSIVSAGDGDPTHFREVRKYEGVYEMCLEYGAAAKEREELLGMIGDSDPEMAQMAKDDLSSVEERVHKIEQAFVAGIATADEVDECDVFLETQGGAGGTEGELFATELFESYEMFARQMGWKWTTERLIDDAESDEEGVSEKVQKCNLAKVQGTDVMKLLKWESGVHRVQRVPVTEGSGKLQTSTAGVKVLPCFDESEVVIDIPPSDIKWWATRGSGPGGQAINTGNPRATVKHIPTGITVMVFRGRDFALNKALAMGILRSKLWEIENDKKLSERRDARRPLAFTLDRHNRVRTYSWPRQVVTDHRLTTDRDEPLRDVMDGKLEGFAERLTQQDRENRFDAYCQEQTKMLRDMREKREKKEKKNAAG